ncbi:MAG: M28 family peptidase [Deltaproteobacteria bacterium]|nr:M28 family peptidase [Deltaproteobacteria bacterium]MBI2992297.1 M28 family peptidase [Deltaproteobacteria bacterium]
MTRVDPIELKRKVQHIVGERSPFSSPRHLAAVESYIEKEFESYGLSVDSDAFTYWGRGYRNVIGRLGAARGGPLIILGAHFDSVEGSPGADDNASGVAVLLEAARILSTLRLRSQVLFCAFNLEELNMVGSTHFAKKLKAAGADIRAMVSLEMVGFTSAKPGGQQYPAGLRWFYPDRGDFIGVVGNWRSGVLLRQFSRLLRQVHGLSVETLTVLGNGFLVPQVRLSDHSPFWDLGYPALLVTDTAFFRNPHYHGLSDTVETLDLDFMAKVCQGVVNAVVNL